MNEQTRTTSDSGQYMKVLADGTRVPASDPRADHVAVLDTTRNLLIYPHSISVDGKKAKAAALKEEIAKLDVLGGNWRMAERLETESVLDLTRHAPAFDASLFPGFQPDWHVTATPAAWAPARAAWWVGFNLGNVLVGSLGDVGFALAVRPAGQ